VLFLCTGNICRSPAAEGLLRHKVQAAGLDVHVHSAGTSIAGRPITAESGALLARRGIDSAGHRSRTMSAELISGADLVLGMTRGHVREAVLTVNHAWPRSFTLKEIVRRGELAGRRAPDQPLDEWLEKIAAGRKTTDLLGMSEEDDVADPIGLGRDAYEEMVDEVEDRVNRLAHLLWGI
jgi:protein-tyrosine phosphatase